MTRLALRSNSGGASAYPLAGETPLSTRAVLPPAGGTRTYQVFYRNTAPAFCPPGTANWTNGLALSWSP